MGDHNISVTKSAADKLRAEASRRGCSVSKLIAELLDVAEAESSLQRRQRSS